MNCGHLTFCSEEVKWFDQNSVMCSVSGEGVAAISRYHQPRSSTARTTMVRRNALRSSSLICLRRGRRNGSSTQAGGGVTAVVRTPDSSLSTAWS